MSKVLDTHNTPDLTSKLELIVSGHDGWGAAFRELRLRAGLSQKSLATALDLNDATVSHWERGKHRPSTETLRKALALMRIDARLLDQHFPGTLAAQSGAELDTNPKILALK